ncbi:MAG: cyclopropane-fatty-acyl-phospholipid synthase family protein [Steroidobacteraceae bacterium]
MRLGREILGLLFQDVDAPVNIRLWEGTRLKLGRTHGTIQRPFELVFRTPEAVADLVLGLDPLRVVDIHCRGELDIDGDLFSALALKDQILASGAHTRERLGAVVSALRLRARGARAEAVADRGHADWRTEAVHQHSRGENRRAISFHYDLSKDFYSLWLDRRMVYSCAYFENARQSLDDAQQSKLELICRKLLLKPGESFLDIGCGWGALVLHAARHHGVRAHGITLSREQHGLARERIAKAGLSDRASVELCDYRDLAGEAHYDKIASVGMFEHVGLENFATYFGTAHRLLRPGGLFLNHGITHDSEGWHRNLSTEFINRYVFPDGQLDTIGNVVRAMERALQFVPEPTYRIWRLYMAACALEFESGGIGIYQVLASRRSGRLPGIPLTRHHLLGGVPRNRTCTQDVAADPQR